MKRTMLTLALVAAGAFGAAAQVSPRADDEAAARAEKSGEVPSTRAERKEERIEKKAEQRGEERAEERAAEKRADRREERVEERKEDRKEDRVERRDDATRAEQRKEDSAEQRATDRAEKRADDPPEKRTDRAETLEGRRLEARITENERDGRLTRREAAALREDLAQLREYEDRAREGDVTRDERLLMDSMRTELSRRIDRPEGDGPVYSYRASPRFQRNDDRR